MVRLKVGTAYANDALDNCFNSKMVRLKVGGGALIEERYTFQFQNGAIKSM